MPPSESMNFRFGCRCNTPENTRSAVLHIRLVENVAIATANGALGSMEPVAKEKPGT